jgi:hypothetical protein
VFSDVGEIRKTSFLRGGCVKHIVPVVALAALCACKSTAPYTVPAAAINTAAALGLSAQQRSQGKCFSTCTNKTVCIPRTGYCEPLSAHEVCVEAEGGGMRCTHLALTGERQPGAKPPAALTPTLGLSPMTGTLQPPPAEASPRVP